MTLTLTVTSYRGERPARTISTSFGVAGGTIGRAADCTWILPDQYEIVSRRHCHISCASGKFWITDTSSKNGLSINGGPRLERNVPVAIAAGDRLTIGDYEIEARLDPCAAPSPRDRKPEPVAFGSNLGELHPARSPPFNPARADGFIEPLFGGAPPSAPMSSSLASQSMASSSFTPPGFAPSAAPGADWLASPEPDIAPIAQQVVHIAWPVAGPAGPATGLPLNWNPFEDDAPEPPPAPPAALRSPVAPGPVEPPVRVTAHHDEARLLAAFLDGAGLPPESLGGADSEAVLRAAGGHFRALVGGLRELLIARAQVKNELRVAHTVIGGSASNPLKTSQDDEQAVLALLAPRGHALKGEQAIAEAFKDMKQHEFALLAGARSAVTAALAHFDPATLSHRLANGAQGSLAALLPMARKAKYWELFENEFRRVADEAEEDAHGPLARALARAYEEQKKKC